VFIAHLHPTRTQGSPDEQNKNMNILFIVVVVSSLFRFLDLHIFPATEACTPKVLLEYIFGDSQQRKELGVKVAEPGWIGLGVTGDNFGMIMVNCNGASPYFGEVWNCTNNCVEEKNMASCLDTMLE
jgi:hypothetical protein